LSIVTVEYQMFGVFPDDGRGDWVVVVDPQLIKVIDRDQLLVRAFFGLIGDEFTAQPVGLLA